MFGKLNRESPWPREDSGGIVILSQQTPRPWSVQSVRENWIVKKSSEQSINSGFIGPKQLKGQMTRSYVNRWHCFYDLLTYTPKNAAVSPSYIQHREKTKQNKRNKQKNPKPCRLNKRKSNNKITSLKL